MLDNDLFPETRVVSPANELDERYTLREDVAWSLKELGADAYDLDVAACEESHHAPKWYARARDGLKQPWAGRVWCNPPYSNIEPWVAKAWREVAIRCDSVSMLLPSSRTEQPWWQRLVEPYRDQRAPAALPLEVMHARTCWPTLTSHFLPGRTRFGMPGNPLGIGVGSPPFACVLLIWRRKPA